MKQVIHDIVAWCDAHHENAVEMVRDYFTEKDTYVTRSEVQWLVTRARREMKRTHA